MFQRHSLPIPQFQFHLNVAHSGFKPRISSCTTGCPLKAKWLRIRCLLPGAANDWFLDSNRELTITWRNAWRDMGCGIVFGHLDPLSNPNRLMMWCYHATCEDSKTQQAEWCAAVGGTGTRHAMKLCGTWLASGTCSFRLGLAFHHLPSLLRIVIPCKCQWVCGKS